MNALYLTSIIAFDSIVILFAFLFGVIPGKRYRYNIHKIQLLLASMSFIVGMVACILAKVNENAGLNTLYTLSFLMIFEAVYGICLVVSIYKFISMEKAIKGLQTYYMTLKSSDYKLVNELDFPIEMFFLPKVQGYAVSEDSTLIFSGPKPSTEIDAEFLCRKLGDKVYECFSYIDLSPHRSVKRVLNDIFSHLIVIVSLMVPVLVAYMDFVFIKTSNVDEFYNLFLSIVLFLLGATGSKLFANVEGLLGKCLYYFSIILVAASICCLIMFFR